MFQKKRIFILKGQLYQISFETEGFEQKGPDDDDDSDKDGDDGRSDKKKEKELEEEPTKKERGPEDHGIGGEEGIEPAIHQS